MLAYDGKGVTNLQNLILSRFPVFLIGQSHALGINRLVVD